MSDNKKDLTRIEDLGEYLHELSQEDESETTFETEALPEFPTPDAESEPLSFTSDENTFETSPEAPVENEQNLFSTEEVSFESSEPQTTFDGSENDFKMPEENEDREEETIEESETLFNEIPEPLDFTPEPEPEPEPIKTRQEPQAYLAPEKFEDLKRFAENSSFTGMGAEGNPSFSVLLKNIRYLEDVNDILALMRELGLLSDSEDQLKQRLMRGHLLVPRISEYSAIYLAHKLRRFDIDIQVGLSDEIHPPKHQETPEIGLTSKHSLYQNQIHHFQFDDSKLELSQIIVAATPHLEGHQVVKYLGVASEHKMVEGHIIEDEVSEEVPRHYSELAQKLKAHAMKAHANAVIGLNYQLTPLPTEYGTSGNKYRLSCTGNLVWVNKL